jgi:hypothetical protein
MGVSGQFNAPAGLHRGKKPPGTHQIRGWVGPSVGPDAVEKRKILHYQESNPSLPARSPTLYWNLSYKNCLFDELKPKKSYILWYINLQKPRYETLRSYVLKCSLKYGLIHVHKIKEGTICGTCSKRVGEEKCM